MNLNPANALPPAGNGRPVLRGEGFTLAEVAISVGIATICILTLLGLVPFGLETLRSSANRQAEARMIQAITASYQMTTWIKQGADGGRQVVLADRLFYFDQTGTELGAATDPARLYTVQAKVDAAVPRLAGDAVDNPYLRKLNLRFTARQDYEEAFKDGSGQYTERPAWIVNVEQTGPVPVP
jgi:uncharacterized protein (TIGR02598 family)